MVHQKLHPCTNSSSPSICRQEGNQYNATGVLMCTTQQRGCRSVTLHSSHYRKTWYHPQNLCNHRDVLESCQRKTGACHRQHAQKIWWLIGASILEGLGRAISRIFKSGGWLVISTNLLHLDSQIVGWNVKCVSLCQMWWADLTLIVGGGRLDTPRSWDMWFIRYACGRTDR